MERKLRKAINTWLEAERGADPNRAESALRQVFLRLPLHSPPVDFVDQVLLRLGIRPAELSTPFAWRLRWRFAAGLCLGFLAIGATALPRLVAFLWSAFGPGQAVDWGASLLVGLSARLAHGLVLWDALSTVAQTVSSSLFSPTILAALAASVLLGAGALRLLHLLVITERTYVQPH